MAHGASYRAGRARSSAFDMRAYRSAAVQLTASRARQLHRIPGESPRGRIRGPCGRYRPLFEDGTLRNRPKVGTSTIAPRQVDLATLTGIRRQRWPVTAMPNRSKRPLASCPLCGRQPFGKTPQGCAHWMSGGSPPCREGGSSCTRPPNGFAWRSTSARFNVGGKRGRPHGIEKPPRFLALGRSRTSRRRRCRPRHSGIQGCLHGSRPAETGTAGAQGTELVSATHARRRRHENSSALSHLQTRARGGNAAWRAFSTRPHGLRPLNSVPR